MEAFEVKLSTTPTGGGHTHESERVNWCPSCLWLAALIGGRVRVRVVVCPHPRGVNFKTRTTFLYQRAAMFLLHWR